MYGLITHYRHRLTLTVEVMTDLGRSMQKETHTCGSRREYDRRVQEERHFLRSLDLKVTSLAVPVSEDEAAHVN